MDRRLQEALFRAAEDTEFAGEGPRRIFADAALRHRPLERRIAEAIEAFGREIPRQVKVAVTYRLGREQGAVFFAALAEAAPSLSTEHMVPVAAAIRRDILDGRVDPGEPGLAQLRDHLESRRGFPKGAQIPGEPQSPAPEWWLTRTGSTLAMGLWCHLESRTSVAVVCSFPVRTTTGSGCGTRYWSSSIDPWRGIPDPWDAPRHRSRALRRCAGWLRDLWSCEATIAWLRHIVAQSSLCRQEVASSSLAGSTFWGAMTCDVGSPSDPLAFCCTFRRSLRSRVATSSSASSLGARKMSRIRRFNHPPCARTTWAGG